MTTLVVRVPLAGAAQAWRMAARRLLAEAIPPERCLFLPEGDAQPELFGPESMREIDAESAVAMTVPKRFIEIADAVACHRDPERFQRLYRLVWRLRTTPALIHDESAPELARLMAMAKAVRRDTHKMRAFVRFREDASSAAGGRRRFFAWFEPDHHIVERNAPFFMRRFADMDWTIATPSQCADFTDGRLTILPGTPRPPLPEDATDDLWRTYFTHTFNPARLKVKAMQSEMPKKYWRNLPEAALIPDLIAGAEARVREMRERQASIPPARAERVKARAGRLG